MFVLWLHLCCSDEVDRLAEFTNTIEKIEHFAKQTRKLFGVIGRSRYFSMIGLLRDAAMELRNKYISRHKETYIRHNSKVDRTRTRWYYDTMKDSQEVELPREKDKNL